MPWPKDWSTHLGESVVLEGVGANAELGALLQEDGLSIWIEGLEAWPPEFEFAANRGKPIRVSGTVIKKDDLPVFVVRRDEPQRAGIPVQSEKDFQTANWRYLLEDAEWTVLD